MDAVVLHDGSAHPGGGALVAIEAAKALDADLYIGYSGVDVEWWSQQISGKVSVLTGLETTSQIRDLWLIRKILKLDLSEYDLVLTSGPVTKFYYPSDGQRRAHYMHHPPLPLLWFEGGPLMYLFSLIDRVETQSIETVLANSELTASRAGTLYAVDPTVVMPPVEVDRFNGRRDPKPGKVVMVGRLEERKRPEVAIEAFRQLDADLHLVGEGPLRKRLERNAPNNVIFHGYVDDEELRDHLLTAEAGLFLAKREDFGVTPIEYLAAGLPVIGVDEPNTNNQIDDPKFGRLVAPEASDVVNGVQYVLDEDYDSAMLRNVAREYRPEVFREELRQGVL